MALSHIQTSTFDTSSWESAGEPNSQDSFSSGEILGTGYSIRDSILIDPYKNTPKRFVTLPLALKDILVQYDYYLPRITKSLQIQHITPLVESDSAATFRILNYPGVQISSTASLSPNAYSDGGSPEITPIDARKRLLFETIRQIATKYSDSPEHVIEVLQNRFAVTSLAEFPAFLFLSLDGEA